MTHFLQEAHPLTGDERIFNGLTALQWSTLETHLHPAVLRDAQSQPTRAQAASILVREGMRTGLLPRPEEE